MTARVSFSVNGTDVPCDRTLTGIRITYGGAADPRQAMDPATCQVSFLPTLANGIRPVAGDRLAVTVHRDDGTSSQRFTGTVDWTGTTFDAAGIAKPVTVILAVGDYSRVGRIYVGDEPWPVESDGDRAGRVLALAAAQWPGLVWRSAPGRLNVRARDVDRQPAAGLLAEIASSAGGVITDTRTGVVEYLDAGTLSGVAPAFTLDACHVLTDSYTVQAGGAFLVNVATVAYGSPTVPGDDSTRPTLTVSSAESVARFGPYSQRFDTELATAGDAADFAALVLSRLAWPLPNVPAAVVTSRTLPAADHAAFLDGLAMLGRCLLTGLPLPGPAGLDAAINGWSETWESETAWRVDLTLTDVRQRGLGTRWVDVPCVRWVDVDPALTWADADTWAPCPPITGRWIDQPGNLWWQAATGTWNEWSAA
jgi:hypothetical protein